MVLSKEDKKFIMKLRSEDRAYLVNRAHITLAETLSILAVSVAVLGLIYTFVNYTVCGISMSLLLSCILAFAILLAGINSVVRYRGDLKNAEEIGQKTQKEFNELYPDSDFKFR